MNWDLNDVDLDLVADAMLHARPDLRFYFDPDTGNVVEADRNASVTSRWVEIPILDAATLREIALSFVAAAVDDKVLAKRLTQALEGSVGLADFDRLLGDADPDLALDWYQELDNCALEAAESWLDSISE